VTDEAVWASYYADFPLVRIADDRIEWWATPVAGARALVVSAVFGFFAFRALRELRRRLPALQLDADGLECIR
jgi:hypothetical protein